jgi:lipopolysaccharide export system permease protein
VIIDRYLLKRLIPPFIFASATLIFIFLLQFLMKTADNLIGKGLDAWVIIMLIVYNLSWMFVLVVPMACLGAVLMTFGSLTQENELTILKSSGVSLVRLMIPVILLSGVVGCLLIEFNNKVLPDANYHNKNLMYDISRTKPTLKLEGNVFSKEIPNYSILAREVSKNTNELFNVTIYDFTNILQINIITAKKANVYFTRDNKKLLFELDEGEIHQSIDPNNISSRRIFFKKHRIAMDAEQFLFEQSGPGAQRGDRELSAQDMQRMVDSLQKISKGIKAQMMERIASYYEPILKADQNILRNDKAPAQPETINLIYFALNDTKSKLMNITNDLTRIEYLETESNRYLVEIHKKYAIPVACIVFVLIGAPIGVITRKGSFGVAASISLFFFLIYWACLIGGEKLADRGMLAPWLGMWIANIIIGLIGIYLTYRMNKEQIIIDFTFLRRFIPKAFRVQQTEPVSS